MRRATGLTGGDDEFPIASVVHDVQIIPLKTVWTVAFAVITILVLATSSAYAQADAASPPMPKTSTDFGEWKLECFGLEERGGPCQLYQRVETDVANLVAMASAIAITEKGTLQAQIVLPLGIDLSRPPQLLIEEEAVSTLPVSRCLTKGCLVEGTLPDALVDRLADGNLAEVVVFFAGERSLKIPFPLLGLDAGLAKLREITPRSENETAAVPTD